METLGAEPRTKAQANLIRHIIETDGSFFEIKKYRGNQYAIFNRVTGKKFSEKAYPKEEALAILEQLQ